MVTRFAAPPEPADGASTWTFIVFEAARVPESPLDWEQEPPRP
jgi:hypothetical protein